MVEETFTGVTSKTDIEIHKPCRAILLISNAKATGTEVITAKMINSKNANENIGIKLNMVQISEFAAQGEGAFVIDGDAQIAKLGAGVRSVLKFPLAQGGYLPMDGTEYLSVSIEGLTTGTTYTVLSEEALTPGMPLVYSKPAISAPKVQQQFKGSIGDVLILPTTAFESIDLVSKNAKSITYTKDELITQHMDGNDIVAYDTVTVDPAGTPTKLVAPVYGFYQNFLVSLKNISLVEINCSGTAGYSFVAVNIVEPRPKVKAETKE